MARLTLNHIFRTMICAVDWDVNFGQTDIALIASDSSDISFQVQFNAEFPRQVMNFPIKRLNTQFNLYYVIVISINMVSFLKGT